MQIKDLYGDSITVTDLKAAIEQAHLFKNLSHIDPTPKMKVQDYERKQYWTDIYRKLLQLQSTFKNQ
jgi:hypothetical protein